MHAKTHLIVPNTGLNCLTFFYYMQAETENKISSEFKEIVENLNADDFDFSDLSMEQTKVEEKPKQFVFMLTGFIVISSKILDLLTD